MVEGSLDFALGLNSVYSENLLI